MCTKADQSKMFPCSVVIIVVFIIIITIIITIIIIIIIIQDLMYLLFFPQFTPGATLLIRNDDLVWIQSGISVVFQICSDSPSLPVYTRVSSYQEWIKEVTGSSQLGFVTFPSSGGVSTSTSSPTSLSTSNSISFINSDNLTCNFFTSISALLLSLLVLVVWA